MLISTDIEVSLVYTIYGKGEKRKFGKNDYANFMFTESGFSLNLGFRNFLCSQTMDSVLFEVSQICFLFTR